jgi:hypothetical protein
MTKVYDTATDMITFARSSSGTALRRVGYGDELVVDGSGNWIGDFDVAADVSEWTVGLGGSASHTGTAMELTVGASTLCKIEKPYTFSSNKLYRLTFEITSSSAGVSRVYNYSADELHNFGPGNTTGTFEHVFAGGSSTRGFDIRIEGTQGSTASIDNISIKEVIFDRATDDLVLFNHPDDIPRIEYGSDGSLKGLLIEEQRTNLVTHSGDFTQWHTFSGEVGVTQSADTIYGVSAYEITGSTGGFGLGRLSPNGAGAINLTSAGVLTFWAKKIVTGSSLQYLWDGSVLSFDAQVPNDGEWHKVEISLPAANSALQLLRGFTSGTVAVAMAQLEEGSFPTSYIPTSGSQVTRWADVASIPVSAFGYNQDAGTVVVEFDMVGFSPNGPTGYPRVWEFNQANSDYISVQLNSSGQAAFRDNESNTNLKYSEALTENTMAVMAATFADDDLATSLDGATALTATPSYTLDLPTTLAIGSVVGGGRYLNGHIKSLKYYPRRLTNTQLQELTA